MTIEKKTLLATLPPEWQWNLLPHIQKAVKKSGLKIVVLDDDPTGTQTVHDVTVLTRWDKEALSSAFKEPDALVYILTNSRSYPLEKAEEINREIALNLLLASQLTGRRFSVVSRSDSTLRGHFPGEVDALIEELGQRIDGILVIPFFEEGGRLTISNIHYVAEREMLVPAGETEYAKDATFGYSNSDLRAWVSEKSYNRIKAEDVESIDLSTIRKGGPDAVGDALKQLENRCICIVNAVSYRDMEVFVSGLLQAEAAGKCFVYRTAASFVRVRGGLEPRPLLSIDQLRLRTSTRGGLIIAGSYIRKSSEQIVAVQKMAGIASFEVSVPHLLNANFRAKEITRVYTEAERLLIKGQDVLIYTSRELIKGTDELTSVQIGKLISAALVEIVQNIHSRPAWIVAKGGITSSDVATEGLKIRRAKVLGQILPGVPVWRSVRGSRWPGLVYVVFPGNVGGPNAIAEVVQQLRGASYLRPTSKEK